MIEPPLAMTAELTHACPLHCVYCSNPLDLVARDAELPAHAWLDVLEEAERLGVLQVHLSGGEPLLFAGLDDVVERAAQLELYSNLITSGVGLDRERAAALAAAGLSAVQLSFQGAGAVDADVVAGRRAHAVKLAAAEAVRAAGLPLSLNVVLHRRNLGQVDALVDLALRLGASRLELANAQYHGWALRNRSLLLPGRDQLRSAEERWLTRRDELRGQLELVWVLPDYLQPFPKPCMGGWGRRLLTVAPDGTVLPCSSAASITSLRFERVPERPLAWIWERSESFNAFRGEEWMPAPCRTCERRQQDFGGCRCQAFALTGDAARTDPVCHLAPDHALVESAVATAESNPGGRLIYRRH